MKYLVEQNRAINVLPAQGGIRESRIDIPIAIESIQPATVDFVESSYLASIIHGCEPFAFLVPRVKFLAVREGWTVRGICIVDS